MITTLYTLLTNTHIFLNLTFTPSKKVKVSFCHFVTGNESLLHSISIQYDSTDRRSFTVRTY